MALRDFLKRQAERSKQLRGERHGRDSRAPENPRGTLRTKSGEAVGKVKTEFGPGERKTTEARVTPTSTQVKETSTSTKTLPPLAARSSPRASSTPAVEVVPFTPPPIAGQELPAEAGESLPFEAVEPVAESEAGSTTAPELPNVDLGELPEIEIGRGREASTTQRAEQELAARILRALYGGPMRHPSMAEAKVAPWERL